MYKKSSMLFDFSVKREGNHVYVSFEGEFKNDIEAGKWAKDIEKTIDETLEIIGAKKEAC